MISEPKKTDGPRIHAISAGVGVFSQEEVECVDELWGEYQAQGPERSGYYWLVDREGDQVAGYACYGPRALTSGRTTCTGSPSTGAPTGAGSDAACWLPPRKLSVPWAAGS
jgi:hypothetical protein